MYEDYWFYSSGQKHLPLCISMSKKLYLAAVFTVFTSGHHWHNKPIILFPDNSTVCNVWLSTISKDSNIMFYIHHLFLYSAKRNINIFIKNVPSEDNINSDLISRTITTLHWPLTKPSPINQDIWHLSYQPWITFILIHLQLKLAFHNHFLFDI